MHDKRENLVWNKAMTYICVGPGLIFTYRKDPHGKSVCYDILVSCLVRWA